MEPYIFYLVAIIICVIFSAFFSAAETAITGGSKAKFHKLKMEGNKRAKIILKLREDKDKVISAVLLGNTAINILASAIATSFAIGLWGEEGVAIATLVMTVVILVFSEVLPKTYAFENSEKFSLAIAPILVVILKLLYPIIKVIQWIVNLFLVVLKLRNKNKEIDISTDELRGAIELHHDEGAVVKTDRDMLGSILDLADMTVTDIMIHRKNIETINVELDNKEIINKILASTHTRIPIWQDNHDNIIGVLNIKDVLKAMKNAEKLENIDIKSLATEPWFVPETTLLRNQLREFRLRRNHFAIVVDEYGGIKGIVTLEDILEEIVGQIEDEHDRALNLIKDNKDGSYTVDGTLTIRDINRELDWDLPDDYASTIAGLLINEVGDLPKEGAEFEFFGIYFKILKRYQNQIISIKVRKLISKEEN